ncbi:MAG: recombinase family protein [Myxococcales bacterium]|nr:recombinase family protein [Myxococcales bacterium]
MKRAKNGGQKAAPEVKRCAVYTRKSTSQGLEQEFNSLDAQREACVGYIQRQPGWTLVDEHYDDGGFTGANIERPAFQRLLADAEAGKIDVVVVYKVDRLSRSLLDFAKVMERFNAADASFVSVTQNFSTADAMGRLTLNMLMSFAEFERSMIAERTRDKITMARRRGKWTGGPVPLGYKVEEKHLVVDELEAVLVREIFAVYLEQRSALAVARILNERHRSTKRHRAANGNLRESRGWNKADVLRVLKNPVYAGYMPCGGELHEAEHAPLIPRETFTRATTLLEEATLSKEDHGRNPDYLLRGLLRCACCGAGFTPASTRKGRREFRYYRCITRDKEGKDACPSRPLSAGAIEDYVLERLRAEAADGSLATEVVTGVKQRVAARRKDILTERQKLPPEIASLSDEGKRLVETIASVNGAGRRLLDERLQEVGEQLARCEARLATAERELANLDALEVEVTWVAQCLADFDKVWDVLTPENRGRVLRTMVERVEVNEPANQVSVFVTDLTAGLPGETPTSEPKQQEARP